MNGTPAGDPCNVDSCMRNSIYNHQQKKNFSHPGNESRLDDTIYSQRFPTCTLGLMAIIVNYKNISQGANLPKKNSKIKRNKDQSDPRINDNHCKLSRHQKENKCAKNTKFLGQKTSETFNFYLLGAGSEIFSRLELSSLNQLRPSLKILHKIF